MEKEKRENLLLKVYYSNYGQLITIATLNFKDKRFSEKLLNIYKNYEKDFYRLKFEIVERGY